MERINIIPKPNKIELLGGEVCVDTLEVTSCVDPSLGNEEYILTADENGVKIEGGSERAVFYGKQSLDRLKDTAVLQVGEPLGYH